MLAYIILSASLLGYGFLWIFDKKRRMEYSFSIGIALFKVIFFTIFWIILLFNIFNEIHLYFGIQTKNTRLSNVIIYNEGEQSIEVLPLRLEQKQQKWEVASIKNSMFDNFKWLSKIKLETKQQQSLLIEGIPEWGDKFAFTKLPLSEPIEAVIIPASAKEHKIYAYDILNSGFVIPEISKTNLISKILILIAGMFASLYHLLYAFKGINRYKFIKIIIRLFHFILFIIFGIILFKEIYTLYLLYLY